MKVDLRLGDCLDVLRSLPDASVDAVVTDPPAGISFMGKGWDSDHGGRDRWVEWLAARMAEARRVAKPGAYALVWALPRTSHWTGWALEEAGWVIRDRVAHLFGTGFPKGKACLKPACEDWWLAWNPAKRVTPLNIEDCRIPAEVRPSIASTPKNGNYRGVFREGSHADGLTALGRWPANVTHDGSDEVLAAFAAFGERGGGFGVRGRGGNVYANGNGFTTNLPETGQVVGHGDTGTAARFFYAAKASKADRGEGNTHPTVKNTALMRWLCRLIARPGDVVLDPFAGSGSTLVAALAEGMDAVGIEANAEYHAIARRRIDEALNAHPLLDAARA